MDKLQNVEQMKKDVLETIKIDLQAAEFSIAIFSAAVLSYRKDTCLRPYPDIFEASVLLDTEERLHRLVSMKHFLLILYIS